MKEKKITSSSQIELLLFIEMRFCFRNEIISDGLLKKQIEGGSRRREGVQIFGIVYFVFFCLCPLSFRMVLYLPNLLIRNFKKGISWILGWLSVTFYHVLWKQPLIRICIIIALHDREAIFHVIELFSTNQIPFHQMRLRSMTCHFRVNKLESVHLITDSNRIVQSHWKKIHKDLTATDNEVFTQFSRVLTFSTNKIGFQLSWI